MIPRLLAVAAYGLPGLAVFGHPERGIAQPAHDRAALELLVGWLMSIDCLRAFTRELRGAPWRGCGAALSGAAAKAAGPAGGASPGATLPEPPVRLTLAGGLRPPSRRPAVLARGPGPRQCPHVKRGAVTDR